jgi:hypothetical protein
MIVDRPVGCPVKSAVARIGPESGPRVARRGTSLSSRKGILLSRTTTAIRRAVTVTVLAALALGGMLGSPGHADDALCSDELTALADNPYDPLQAGATGFDPCLLSDVEAGLADAQVAAGCATYARAFVHTWLAFERIAGTAEDYWVDYLWTGAGYATVPAVCAREVTVHTQLTNTALLPQTRGRPREEGKTQTVTVRGTADYLTAQPIANVKTNEFDWAPPPSTRGPALVTVRTWGSYLPAGTSTTRLPIRCWERTFQVQANPASTTGTRYEEVSYAECPQQVTAFLLANDE